MHYVHKFNLIMFIYCIIILYILCWLIEYRFNIYLYYKQKFIGFIIRIKFELHLYNNLLFCIKNIYSMLYIYIYIL